MWLSVPRFEYRLEHCDRRMDGRQWRLRIGTRVGLEVVRVLLPKRKTRSVLTRTRLSKVRASLCVAAFAMRKPLGWGPSKMRIDTIVEPEA